ncbi:MAG TPA: class I SAM-dependent methyltransferase [Armatimonadota bacterium]|nr:class I SAM-dependent methyltransferase [Armatimonadota bacterium]
MDRETAYLARDFARFYDWTYEGRVEDIPFYINAARAPILELACGTGRITIPLARAGFQVVGLDISAEMLEIAKEKLSREPSEVRARIRLLEADMSAFILEEPTALVLIPQASFFHLHTRPKQAGCLSCIHQHLLPGGSLIVDLIPARMMLNQTVGVTDSVRRGVSSYTGRMTQELNRKLSIDKPCQRVTVEHTYIEEQPDGHEDHYVFVDSYTWVTEGQMRKMLRAVGFGSIEVFGDYDRQPLTHSSPRMIFMARKQDHDTAEAALLAADVAPPRTRHAGE